MLKFNLKQHKITWSVPRHVFSTFGRFLIKMHIPVEKVQLKSMKIQIFQGVIINTSSFFYSEKFTETITDSLRRFKLNNVDIISQFGSHTKYLAQFFNVITRVPSCLLQCRTLVDLLILAVYWNLTSEIGRFNGKILGFFLNISLKIICTLRYSFEKLYCVNILDRIWQERSLFWFSPCQK